MAFTSHIGAGRRAGLASDWATFVLALCPQVWATNAPSTESATPAIMVPATSCSRAASRRLQAAVLPAAGETSCVTENQHASPMADEKAEEIQGQDFQQPAD